MFLKVLQSFRQTTKRGRTSNDTTSEISKILSWELFCLQTRVMFKAALTHLSVCSDLGLFTYTRVNVLVGVYITFASIPFTFVRSNLETGSSRLHILEFGSSKPEETMEIKFHPS